MTKYGFERWQAEDFSDDGNRFTCYKVGNRVRVSKLVRDGRAYISARIDGIKLPYEVYSQLPHYKVLDDLNGISVDNIDEDDLLELYHACVEYEQEYNAAEANLDLPTIEELELQCAIVINNVHRQIAEVECAIKNNITKLMVNLDSYKWDSIKHYYNSLLKEVDRYKKYPAQMLGTAQSISFCKPNKTLSDSYYYEALMKIINNAVGGN
jgi:hypothetical protein